MRPQPFSNSSAMRLASAMPSAARRSSTRARAAASSMPFGRQPSQNSSSKRSCAAYAALLELHVPTTSQLESSPLLMWQEFVDRGSLKSVARLPGELLGKGRNVAGAAAGRSHSDSELSFARLTR